MKNLKLILISLISLLLIIILTFFILNNKKTEKKAKIIQYEIGTSHIMNEIEIDSKEVKKFIKQIKPLKEEKMVNLSLVQEIEIVYNDDISIAIQKYEKNYCYYTNKKENVSYLTKMPDGLYEWVESKIKI